MPTGIYKRTEKHIEQIRALAKSRIGTKRPPFSREWIENIRRSNLGKTPWNKGKKCPQLSGMNHGMYGKTHSTEVRKKLSEYAKNRIGEKSFVWKGDSVTYRGLHRWVESRLGTPEKCEHCKKEGLTGHSINWANVSKEYKRELSDWIRLCVKCHRAFDKK